MSQPTPAKIIVFSAPSGAGKTTLLNHLRDSVPGLAYSVSATTRPPRPGEVDGKHYFFLSEDEFKRRIQAGEFAEWQLVHNNYYGTPRRFIDESVSAGRHVVMDIDVHGKKTFDRLYPQAIGILVEPPSLGELEQRLRDRRSDGEQTIRVRLANATEELAFARREGKYEHTIVNDDLERTKAQIVALVTSIVAG